MSIEYIKNCIETDIKANVRPGYNPQAEIAMLLLAYVRHHENPERLERLTSDLEVLVSEGLNGDEQPVSFVAIRGCQKVIKELYAEKNETAITELKHYIHETLDFD